jgi:hypothetical protein
MRSATAAKPPRSFFCEHCGNEALQTSHKRVQRFCSTSCARRTCNAEKKAANRQQGVYPNGREAKEALLRDRPACRRCGWNEEPQILELHHADRNRRNNHLSNLRLLCPTCHTLTHWQSGTGQFKNNRGRKASFENIFVR